MSASSGKGSASSDHADQRFVGLGRADAYVGFGPLPERTLRPAFRARKGYHVA